MALFLMTLCFFMQDAPVLQPSVNAPKQGIIFGRYRTVDDIWERQTINHVTRDRFGFLWLTSDQGLIRYDGYTARTFLHDPDDPNSLSSNFLPMIVQGAGDQLWISSSAGLNRYDQTSGRFDHWKHEPGNPASLPDNRVGFVFPRDDGLLWLGAHDHVVLFDPATGESRGRRIGDMTADGLHSVIEMVQGEANALWILTPTYLIKLDDSLAQVQSWPLRDMLGPDQLPIKKLTKMVRDEQGALWLGLESGLWRFDPTQGANLILEASFLASEFRPGKKLIIRTLSFENQDTLWIATAGGMFRYRLSAHQLDRLQLVNKTVNDAYRRLQSMIAGPEGLLYCGTIGRGFIVIDLGPGTFIPMGGPLLAKEDVHALLQDASGLVFAGTETGLYTLKPVSGGFSQVDVSLPDPILKERKIWSMYEDPQGVVWIGYAGGLIAWNRESGEFQHHDYKPPQLKMERRGEIRAIVQADDGTHWFGTNGMGISRLDQQTGRWQHFLETTDEANALSSNYANCFWPTPEGLWIGTSRGLNLYRFNQEGFERWSSNEAPPRHLSNDFVVSLLGDENGDLWIGTYGGGLTVMSQNRMVRTFTKNDGLPEMSIMAMQWDSLGYLWIATMRGLCRLDPRTGKIDRYFDYQGVQTGPFNVGSSYSRDGDTLFFGGSYGFNGFDPSKIRHDPLLPVTRIETMRFPHVDGRSPRFDGNGPNVLPLLFHESNEPVLVERDAHAIRIDFTALQTRDPMQVRFAYQMEGFDPSWIETGADSRHATYTNLPPGRYQFLLKAANGDGVWSDHVESLAILVPTPFWRQTPALLGYGILMSIIAFSVWRARRHKTLRLARLLLTVLPTGKTTNQTNKGHSEVSMQAGNDSDKQSPVFDAVELHHAVRSLESVLERPPRSKRPIVCWLVTGHVDVNLIAALDPYFAITTTKEIDTILNAQATCQLVVIDERRCESLYLADLKNGPSEPIILSLIAENALDRRSNALERGVDDTCAPGDSLDELILRMNFLIQTRQQVHYQNLLQSSALGSLSHDLPSDEKFLKKALEISHQSMGEPHFTVQWLAEELAVSRRQLHRKLTQITGMTPTEFIRTLRLQTAAELLKKDAGNISEVARTIGFAQVSYFSRQFRQMYGVSPTEFRERAGLGQGPPAKRDIERLVPTANSQV